MHILKNISKRYILQRNFARVVYKILVAVRMIGWMVVLRIYVALAVFKPYSDL